VLAISNASVQRSDGTGYAYTAKRHGSELDLSVSSLPDAVTGPGILSASASIFIDENDNERLDDGELVDSFSLEFDELQRRIDWDDLSLSGSLRSEHNLMVKFAVEGRDRSVQRVLDVIGAFNN